MLIKCPECGKEASDRASSCIHCGYPLQVTPLNEDIMKDIHFLLSGWFVALEDEGVNPWEQEECVTMANKYQYTMQEYQAFLRTLS